MLLSASDNERLNFIRNHVKNHWEKHKGSHFFFTPHDCTHSLAVEGKLNEIIPHIKAKPLSTAEYFVVICAAWLHDIGMIPNLLDNKSDIGKISKEHYLELRDKHHDVSQEYIESNYDKLGLSNEEARAIGLICKFHRKKLNINECKDLRPNYRCKLLSAIFRISDALHVDSTRVEEYKYLYNLFLSMGMPRSSEFHWLKSFWIRHIELCLEQSKIIIHFYLSNDKDKIEDQELIVEHARNEIAEEVDSCCHVLIEEASFSINHIEVTCDMPPKEEDKVKIKQVISQLKIDHTASSSQLFNIVSDTIKFIISSEKGPQDEIVQMLTLYNTSEIKEMAARKVCHVLVKRLYYIVNKILTDDSTKSNEKIELLLQKIDHMQQSRDRAVEKIVQYAQSILADEGPILLFGCSSIIISALKFMGKSQKESTELYVCECRSKDQYNYKNELIYCDGLKYAENLLNYGFKNVYLIPDIISGNLIKRKKVSKVLFGANAIDIKNNKIGHTAGHLSIIYAAKHCDIPIYILADSYKFGPVDYDLEKERVVSWFSEDNLLKEKLNRLGIKFYNPRSDIIDINNVKMLVTEFGIFPPESIPKKIIDKLNSYIDEGSALQEGENCMISCS